MASQCPYCEKVASILEDTTCYYCHNVRLWPCSKCGKQISISSLDIYNYPNEHSNYVCYKCHTKSKPLKDRVGLKLDILGYFLNSTFIRILIIGSIITWAIIAFNKF